MYRDLFYLLLDRYHSTMSSDGKRDVSLFKGWLSFIIVIALKKG
jgi:hypothetical protein